MVRLVTSIAEPQPRNVYVLVYNKLIFKLNYTHVYFVCQYVRSSVLVWCCGFGVLSQHKGVIVIIENEWKRNLMFPLLP